MLSARVAIAYRIRRPGSHLFTATFRRCTLFQFNSYDYRLSVVGWMMWWHRNIQVFYSVYVLCAKSQAISCVISILARLRQTTPKLGTILFISSSLSLALHWPLRAAHAFAHLRMEFRFSCWWESKRIPKQDQIELTIWNRNSSTHGNVLSESKSHPN